MRLKQIWDLQASFEGALCRVEKKGKWMHAIGRSPYLTQTHYYPFGFS